MRGTAILTFHFRDYNPSLEPCITLTAYFYTFHTYATLFTHFTLHPTLSLHIYTARAEYFLNPDDAVDRRKLGF